MSRMSHFYRVTQVFWDIRYISQLRISNFNFHPYSSECITYECFSPSDKNEETQYTVGECFFSLEQCLKFCLLVLFFWEEKKKSFGQVSEIPFGCFDHFLSHQKRTREGVYMPKYISKTFSIFYNRISLRIHILIYFLI